VKRGDGPKRKTPLSSGDKPMKQISDKKAAEGRTSTFKTTGSQLERGPSTLKRTGPLPRSSNSKEKLEQPGRRLPRAATKRAVPEGFPAQVRALILQRCHGLCEACGQPLYELWHAHHRQRRGQGDHTLANGIALHPLCHIQSPRAVHDNPTWAKSRGLIVRPEEDPAVAVLVLGNRRRVLLHLTEPRYLDPPDGVHWAAA
jgi:hypothetical protein